MSLANKFKTDTAAASGGVWFDYSSLPNADGTIPGFKLARMSKHNKPYLAAMRKLTDIFDTAEDGSITVPPAEEEKAEDAMREAFVSTVLVDWRNFQPNDDGVALPFSLDAARQLFADPAWIDLYGDLTEKARKNANFREKAQQAQAKNS